MSVTWTAVLAACAGCYLVKVAGYLVPHEWLDRPRVARVAGLVTVALLAALFGVQTVVSGGHPTLDARLPAVAVAAGLLWWRAPFVVVVFGAAAVAALVRLAG